MTVDQRSVKVDIGRMQDGATIYEAALHGMIRGLKLEKPHREILHQWDQDRGTASFPMHDVHTLASMLKKAKKNPRRKDSV